MHANAQWIQQLTNNSHIGILVVDKDRKNLFVNDRLCEMFGYDTKTLLSTSAEIFHINHDTFLQFAKLAFTAVLNGKPLAIDYQFKRHDGSLFWVHIAGDPIQATNKVLWTMVDITPRIEALSREKNLAQMIEQTHDAVVSIDLDGTISTWNQGATKLFEYTQQEAIGENISFLHCKEEILELQKTIEILLQTGEYHDERPILTKSKKIITISLSLSLLKDDFDKPINIIGYAQDITDRKLAEKKIQETNYNLQRYLEAIDKIGIGLFVVDEDYNTRYMNQTMIDWFGDQRGKTCYSAVAGLDDPCPYCKLHDVIHENKKVIYEPTTPNGKSFEIVATSIKNSDGTTSKMEFIRNVTAQKEVQHRLQEEKEKFNYQAQHDALTGLPNRVLFMDRFSQAMEKAKRKNTKVALFFIDLDHFKEINDSLGHNVGDEILQIVTKRLKDTLREEDSLSRLGGDEFTIILEDISNTQDIPLIATKILTILSDSIKINNHKLYISSSIGISIFPDDGIDAQDLLKFADSAMYKAKDEGRNNYQFYNESMTEIAFERVLMEASLREALKEEEFVVYYQAQVDGTNDRLIGMEALVRWNHPQMGIVSPARFIPLAEATGLIVQIDRFVMKTAMQQLSSWYEEGLNPGILAMNLAIKQLQKEDFIEVFQSLMQQTHCKSEWLELEVTESQIMKNPQEAIRILQQISDIGVELAIDDFGTGYSSLAYLKRFPINKLKIDQAFIRDLPQDEEDTGIVKAVIALAQALNLKIIAEGVETVEQRDFLINNNCHNIQGYFYSKPLNADEFKKLFLS